MPERSKLHHFVPRLLLRGFAHEGERLSTLDRTTGSSFPQNVGRAAAENDYNTVVTEHGEPSDMAESAIAEDIEGRASAGLRRLRSGKWLDSEVEHIEVAGFVAFQYLRVPAQRQFFDEMASSMAKLQVAAGGRPGLKEALTGDDGVAPSDEDVERLWMAMTSDFDGWSLKLPAAHHLKSSFEMLEGMARILRFGYHWSVQRWARRSLLTSDNPVVLAPGPDHQPVYGIGLGTAGTIMMAIDRRNALVLTNRDDLEQHDAGDAPDGVDLPGTVNSARAINLATASQARRFVYHHPDDTLETLLGPGVQLPPPQGNRLDPDTGRELRESLVKMSNWHAEHPDEPHPMAGFPPLADPPPDATPPAIGPRDGPIRRAAVERRIIRDGDGDG